MTDHANVSEKPQRAKVFVSYSRKDAEVLEHLGAGLDARGFKLLLDRTDIAPAEIWRERLDELILQADAVIFVVSPDSAVSEVCRWEVERTLYYGKKLIPLLWRPTDPDQCPPAVAERNWIAAPASEAVTAFDRSVMDAVDGALSADIDWERERSHWLNRALRWRRGDESAGLLLKFEECAQAEAWAARRPQSASELPEAILLFLAASRAQATADRDRLRSISGRAFVRPIEEAILAHESDRALRMLAAGAILAEDPHFNLVPELWRAGAQALDRVPAWAIADETEQRPQDKIQGDLCLLARVSDDGKRAVLFTMSGEIRMCAAPGGEVLWSRPFEFDLRNLEITTCGDVLAVGFDGALLLLAGDDGSALARTDLKTRTYDACWNAASGRLAAHRDADIIAFDTVSREVLVLGTFGENSNLLAYGADTVIVSEDWGEFGSKCTIRSPHGEHVRRFKRSAIMGAVSPDGGRVAISLGGDILVLDSATGKTLAEFTHADNPSDYGHVVEGLTFDRAGKRLMTGGFDGTARLWDVDAKRELSRLDFGEGMVRPVIFSPDETQGLAIGTDWTMRRWDLATGCEIHRVSDRHVDDVVLHPRMGVAAAGFTDQGEVWTVLRSRLVQLWPGQRGSSWTLTGLGARPKRGSLLIMSVGGRILRLTGEGQLQTVGPTGITASLKLPACPSSAKFAFVDESRNLVVVVDNWLTGAWQFSDGLPLWFVEHEEPVREAVYGATRGATLVAYGQTEPGITGGLELIGPDGRLMGQGETLGWPSAVLWRPETDDFIIGSVEGQIQRWPSDGSPIAPLPGIDGKVEALGADSRGRLFTHRHTQILALDAGAAAWRRISSFNGSCNALLAHPELPLLIFSSVTGLHLIDFGRGAELASYAPSGLTGDALLFAHVNRWVAEDWKRLMMLDGVGNMDVWDIAAHVDSVREPATVIIDRLRNGNHKRRLSENADLLMRDAPLDLTAGLEALRSSL